MTEGECRGRDTVGGSQSVRGGEADAPAGAALPLAQSPGGGMCVFQILIVPSLVMESSDFGVMGAPNFCEGFRYS